MIGKGFRAKISDCGLAHASTLTMLSSGTDLDVSRSIAYIAPEFLTDPRKEKNKEYDNYGFAITGWEILSGKQAYNKFIDSALIGLHVVEGERPWLSDIDENIPIRLINSISDCWHASVHERPTFVKVKCFMEDIMSSLQEDLKDAYTALLQQELSHSLGDSIEVLQTDAGRLNLGDVQHEIEYYIVNFNKVRNSLVHYLDPDNGLLFCLKNMGILNDSDMEKLEKFKHREDESSFMDLNEELLAKYIAPRIHNNNCFSYFIKTQENNDQHHVALYITNGRRHPDSEERLLTQEEIATINANMFCLKNLIKPQQKGFLTRLLARKCISERHKESIERMPENQNERRTEKLLTILKRRSYRDFQNFKLCLNETAQGRIVDILKKGGVVTVRVKLQTIKNNVPISESKLVDLLTQHIDQLYYRTMEQVPIISDALIHLKTNGFDLIVNCAWKITLRFFPNAIRLHPTHISYDVIGMESWKKR